MKNWFRWFFIIGLISAITLTAWGISYYRQDTVAKQGTANGGPPRGMPVEAAQVQIGTVTQEVNTVGTLQANESVVLRSEIAGRVISIHFSEGQAATKGDSVISIDPAEYEAQLAQITAQVELNQMNFDRAQQLHQEKLISQQAYDEIQARLKESRANLALAQVRLSKTKVQAPFNGILGLRLVSPGDYVQPGQAIVNLEDLDTLKVDFHIPEIYLGQVKTGQMVKLRMDAFPDKVFTGRVYAIDPRLDEATRTILLRARIPNRGGELRPGMFARVNLVLGQRTTALLISEQAIVPMGEDKFVFRILEGKAVLTQVKIGQRLDGKVEILEGLHAQDTVVTGGQTKIFDGAPVMMINSTDVKSPMPASRGS